MTIQEAIKSGKRFKRKGWDYWLKVTPNYRLIMHDHLEPIPLRAEDILADDWESEGKSVEVTRSQLMDAFSKVAGRPPKDEDDMANFNALCRHLGLEG